ncbi:MAG: hypothetical protein NTV95_03055 [Candidatus Saccharibacteria bacterium]|nr:hypothetical protein [Candidatus Saccharibacteria bacterium]
MSSPSPEIPKIPFTCDTEPVNPKDFLEIDTATITQARCIGCPLVQSCIDKSGDTSDIMISTAYIRYAMEIQEKCSGYVTTERKIPFSKKVVEGKPVCNSPSVPELPKSFKRGIK